jgi:hypothetical protein
MSRRPVPQERTLADEPQKLVDETTAEGEVAAFLKVRPWIILDALVRFGDGSCVVCEFAFGAESRAGFVALAPLSGGSDLHFVELEPPAERLFNSDGTAAKRMNRAISQVDA